MQELIDKGVVTPKPVDMNLPKAPTARSSQRVVPANVSDTDWKRPRLGTPLPPDWPRWIFAPADTSALVGMKFKAIVQSPVLRKLLPAELGKHLEDAPVPAEEIWLAMRIVPGSQPTALVLLIGPSLEPVAEDLRSKGIPICFLDEHSLLAGEWNALNQALQRVAAGNPGPFAKHASELWAKNDLWLIANRQLTAALIPRNTATTGITGAYVGYNLRDQFVADMVLTSATPAAAARLATWLQTNPKELGLGPVKIEKAGGQVNVHAELDPDQLPASFHEQINAYLGPMLEMVGPKNRAAKVVIQGLDDPK